MKKKDFYVIGAAALLGLCLLILSRSGLIHIPTPDDNQRALKGVEVSQLLAGAEPQTARQLALMAKGAKRQPAASYLRVTVGRSVYEPMPLDQDFELLVNQPGGQYNLAQVVGGVIHMASASCPKQECVHQGSLSLDNRDLRAMQSSIICLPNQVVLELLDERQASAYYGEGT